MEENKFIAFISKHGSKLFFSLLVIAIFAVWGESFLSKSKTHNRQDLIIINQIFERFNRGEFLSSESIESVENILARHPELHPKYDPMLMLAFSSRLESNKSITYAKSIFQQSNSEIPSLYKQYALVTFLISEGKYQEAFEASLQLQTHLANNESYQNLDAMNTLRLLFLANQMHDSTQKNIFWKKLEQHPLYASIEAIFQEGKISLSDYINKS